MSAMITIKVVIGHAMIIVASWASLTALFMQHTMRTRDGQSDGTNAAQAAVVISLMFTFYAGFRLASGSW
jgi:hypothetical protein